MKKRLSDDNWYLRLNALVLLSLLVILPYGFRASTLSNSYGLITVEMPVVSLDKKDPLFHRFQEKPKVFIEQDTPLILLTDSAFYFGDLRAFTVDFSGVRNKFQVPHLAGAPDIPRLFKHMEMWEAERRLKDFNGKDDPLLILMPTKDIPMPIVLRVISLIKKKPRYERLLLADQLL